MITFTTFKALIIIVYLIFVLGAAVISVFAVKELWSMFTASTKRQNKDNI